MKNFTNRRSFLHSVMGLGLGPWILFHKKNLRDQLQPTFFSKNGITYGAKPDEKGAIGGKQDYYSIRTGGDYVVETVDDLLAALAKASPGQVIFIPGKVELDLTTLIYIEGLKLKISEGVTLASNRGYDNSEGALILSDALKTDHMIEILGKGVRITGLRLQGPNPKRHMEHHRKAFGPGGERHKYYYQFPVSNGIITSYSDLEVDNCEISGFSRAGIFLAQGTDHHIHHNYIHHCQYNGLGYGVSLNEAEVLIEYNLFDYNRHSIAGTGKPAGGYIARHNVELGTSLSHCFDMHGGRDRQDGTQIAGHYIEIYNNTFIGPEFAVGIRGEPVDRGLVYQNWFYGHHKLDDAVRPYPYLKTQVYQNALGKDGIIGS